MKRSAVCRLLLTVVLLGIAACDGGPKGPGIINATVITPVNPGAVVLEVTGVGIQGFVGQGDTQAFGAVISATEGRHRVLLVSTSGASLQFGVRVEDLGADPLVAVPLYFAGSDDIQKLVTGVEVHFEN